MRTIYKYEILPGQSIPLPKGAAILSVGAQGDNMFLWAMIDPHEDVVSQVRCIEVYGTGHNIPEQDSLVFIGTVMMRGGSLVFHVFERTS